MKRFIISLLALFLPFSASAAYTDVGNSLQSTAIDYLQRIGFMTGYADGSFGVGNVINRAEMVKLLVAATEVQPDAQAYANCFPDVIDQWFAPYVCYAKEQGWVSGYPDGNFHPEEVVNMVEAIKMIVEIRGYHTPKIGYFGFSPDLRYQEGSSWDDQAWYAPYIASVLNRKILVLEEIYDKAPGFYMTRNTIAEYLYMSLLSEGRISFTFPRSECGDQYITATLVQQNEFIIGAGKQSDQKLVLNAEDTNDFCTHVEHFNPHYHAAIQTNGWHLEFFDHVNNELVEQKYGTPFDDGTLYFATVDYNRIYPIPLGPDKSLHAYLWEYDLSTNTLRQVTDYYGFPVSR